MKVSFEDHCAWDIFAILYPDIAYRRQSFIERRRLSCCCHELKLRGHKFTTKLSDDEADGQSDSPRFSLDALEKRRLISPGNRGAGNACPLASHE